VTLGETLLTGAVTGMNFHPLASIAALVVSGALMGSTRATRVRVAAGFFALLAAWTAADGSVAYLYARQTQLAGEAVPWLFLAVWIAVGLAAGYLLPALAGRAVGVRVTHGTGWMSAIGVSVMLSLALGSIGGGGVFWFAA
jgi:hypothetical protein